MPDYVPAVKYPRTPGYRPEGEENKYNAWYGQNGDQGRSWRQLAGKKIALKDNISLAGVPMMNGASTLEGLYSSISTRPSSPACSTPAPPLSARCIANISAFFSGGSHTCAAGPVHNPHKMGYSAGGSSSGSAVVVATGEADMAIGGDQGGSIRIPAAFSGIYGMKGTFGLVPYTGVMPIEITIDHTGPMTANVRDQRAIAGSAGGSRWTDPRQGQRQRSPVTTEALGGRRQGIAHRRRQRRLWAPEFGSGRRCQGQGGRRAVSASSVPSLMKSRSRCIWSRRRYGCRLPPQGATRIHDEGQRHGDQLARSLQHHAARRPTPAGSIGPTNCPTASRSRCCCGQYFTKHYRGHFYAKAQNLTRKLRTAYDVALSKYDLLLMPTLPIEGDPIAASGRAARTLYPARVRNGSPNTARSTPADIRR